MTKTKTITNRHWRLFKYFNDLTDKQKKEVLSDYDYMDLEEIACERWLVYRGCVYCLGDFMAVNNRVHNPVVQDWQQGWDGYHTDSFFSAVVIKVSDCGDCYQIGLILS